MNTRFAVAVHILTLLDERGGAPVPSEVLAGSINTNPTVVRRMLGALGAAGLTRSQLGAGGGARLARPAREITLLDVYRASGEGAPFALPREQPNPDCLVGRNLQTALAGRFAAATRALEASLGETTIADLLREVKRADERTRRARR